MDSVTMKFGDCESINPAAADIGMRCGRKTGRVLPKLRTHGSGKPLIPQITARTLLGTTDIVGLQKIYQILGSQYIVDI